MTNAEYEAYVARQQKLGLPVFPKDNGVPPKYFGQQYFGSSAQRKNNIRRKRIQKQFK